MRPEKRHTLLALLKAYPDTYWWIDVLCVRDDTPLVIMGDIYKHCKKCYAMLDCAPDLIPKLWEKRKDLKMLQRRYHELIAANLFQVDDDDPALIIHERQEYVKTLIAEEHDSIFEIVQSLFSCRWFDRVWTLQEIVFPKVVMLISETCNYDCDKHQISFGFIAQQVLGPIVNGDIGCDILQTAVGEQMAFAIDALGKKLQMVIRCTPLQVDRHNDPVGNAAIFVNMLASIGRCRRTCTDPRDYVYGVLGLLGMDIPRVDDNPQTVWITFLSVLDTMLQEHTTIARTGERLLTISSHAWNFRLALAKDSDHVYGMLLDLHFDKEIYNNALSE
ncbi:predicted protein [Lichtheimia corymbifera JMRC:FSU:9682]|nr:predicted protein [Lichtheimia corymbifera JMRC:FSU:9682]